jgi:hypothetical protein
VPSLGATPPDGPIEPEPTATTTARLRVAASALARARAILDCAARAMPQRDQRPVKAA